MKRIIRLSSHTKRVGDIGEASIISKLLHHKEIIVSKPVTDNEPYDCIIDFNNSFYRVQIKTCELEKEDGKMVFYTNITNPFTKTVKKYSDKEIDLFAFYCISNGYSGLATISECVKTETFIRTTLPKNGATK